MTLSVDLFYSFRSPLAVRVPGFFKNANPQFARYVVLDSS
jgi:hypothetical protein